MVTHPASETEQKVKDPMLLMEKLLPHVRLVTPAKVGLFVSW